MISFLKWMAGFIGASVLFFAGVPPETALKSVSGWLRLFGARAWSERIQSWIPAEASYHPQFESGSVIMASLSGRTHFEEWLRVAKSAPAESIAAVAVLLLVATAIAVAASRTTLLDRGTDAP